MPVTLRNAPLIEIIAEIRWQPDSAMVVGGSVGGMPPPMIVTDANRSEEFFMRFGAQVHQLGYSLSERVVPSGFPLPVQQPVFRFRKTDDANDGVLYQIGAGMFSCNAFRHYESWEKFSPVLQQGIEILLGTRSDQENPRSFVAANLRYIDAFGPELTGGRNASDFLQEILGFNISLPNGLSRLLDDGCSATPSLQFQIPMPSNMAMNIGIGEGAAHGQPAVIMDTTVATTIEIDPNVDAVMAVMHTARQAIHDMFFEVTAPIQELMKPSSVS